MAIYRRRQTYRQTDRGREPDRVYIHAYMHEHTHTPMKAPAYILHQPDVVCPGYALVSAQSDGSVTTKNCGTVKMAGTSVTACDDTVWMAGA